MSRRSTIAGTARRGGNHMAGVRRRFVWRYGPEPADVWEWTPTARPPWVKKAENRRRRKLRRATRQAQQR